MNLVRHDISTAFETGLSFMAAHLNERIGDLSDGKREPSSDGKRGSKSKDLDLIYTY